jgi:hypothetical protein
MMPAFASNGNDLQSVKGWIRNVKLFLSVLEHAKSHLEDIAEDEEDVEVPPVRGPVPVPEPVPEPVPPPPSWPAPAPAPVLPSPQQRARAAMEAAGYGAGAPATRQPRGRTFVTPGLRQAIVEAARRRPKPTIAVLAHEFDVSTATVSRIMRQRYEPEGEQPWEDTATQE